MPLLADGIQLPDGIGILDVATGTKVVAEVAALERQMAKDEIDLSWWAEVADVPSERLRAEHDKGWQWHKLLGKLKAQSGRLGFAWGLRAANRIQGVIVYRLGDVSEIDPTQPTLFVPNLATAPWNRPWLKSPLFKGVGSGLLRFAAYHSYRFGMSGRVTLEAYPDDRLVAWYTNFGFRVTSRDPDGISVLELTPEAAAPQLARLLQSS